MELNKVMRYYRELKGLTQMELAEQTFLSNKTIGHYETGERTPSIDKLQLIAKALGKTVADFTTVDERLFQPIERIPNPFDTLIIKESFNVLALKEHILERTSKKIIMIIEDHEKLFLNREKEVVEYIMLHYYNFRPYIHFYLGKYDEKRIKNIVDAFEKEEWEPNDKIQCIYNYRNIFTIGEGRKYTVSSVGRDAEDGYPTVEIVTDAGGRGTYPKDWFEFYEQGDPTQPVPYNDYLDFYQLVLKQRFQ